MVTRLRMALLVAGISLAVGASPAQATPISGSFSITGNFLPVSGGSLVDSLDLANAIDFIDLYGSTPTPGVDGEFYVNQAKGDFAPLVNTKGSIKDFSFGGPGGFSPVASFQTLSDFTFNLLSITVVMQTPDFLVLSGSGLFQRAGFDNTTGTFKLTANGYDGTYSFSASEGASPVPEPSTLLVMLGAMAIAATTLRNRINVNA
jgi:hypothetical protein